MTLLAVLLSMLGGVDVVDARRECYGAVEFDRTRSARIVAADRTCSVSLALLVGP